MKKLLTRSTLALVLLAMLLSLTAMAQEKLDLQMADRIRTEGLQNSKIADFMVYLCDIYGPRLADSPQYVKASEWMLGQAKELGLVNAAIEPYGPFGRSWELQKFYGAMTSPQYMPLIGFPKAWTSGTNGVLKGDAVLVTAQTPADLDKYKGKLQGAIVLVQGEQELPDAFVPQASRYTQAELDALMLAPEPGFGRRPGMPNMNIAEMMARRQLQQAVTKFLAEEGVGAILEPGRGRDGTIFVASGGSRAKGAENPPASIVVSTEQYNRIVRILQKNVPVTMEVEVQAQFTTDDLVGTNIVAEIAGVDPKLKSEIVMLGGHFDTWHAATGATDDGAGAGVAFEAMRILKALGVKPRRTIRMALWDAEEQGLVGSRMYVTNHFLDRAKKEKKPEYDKFSVYFNFDNGSGKIRGIYSQGNSAVEPIFAEWLGPMHDLGATTVTHRNTGGTDHLSFDGVGLPGFQFIQDTLDYDTVTHHSNMDVYDHLSRPDLMQAATIMAWFVYNAAMRDEKIPRKYFDINAPMPQRRRF
jgi:carboxypeptidase Q